MFVQSNTQGSTKSSQALDRARVNRGLLTRQSAVQARVDFTKIHPPGKDDKKVPEFYADIINRFDFHKLGNKKLAFIVVAHFVHTLPYFLEAISSMGEIAALISKQSGVIKKVRRTISHLYNDIIFDDINKISLRQEPHKAEAFLRQVFNRLQDYHFVILDHGGYFAPRINDVLVKFKARIIGVVEHTWNGEVRYQSQLDSHGQLPFPILSVAHSRLKGLESNAVARSIVDGITVKIGAEGLNQDLNTLNKILIIGYGHIGEHVARVLKKRLSPHGKKRIYICDKSNHALQNAAKIFSVEHITNDKARFLKDADMIITATSSRVLTSKDFSSLKPGVIIACATSCDDQFVPDALKDFVRVRPEGREKAQHAMANAIASIGKVNAKEDLSDLYPAQLCVRYEHKNNPEHCIYLLADGDSINFSIGSTPNPIIHTILSSLCVNAWRLVASDSSQQWPLNEIQQSDKSDDETIKATFEEHYGPIVDAPLARIMQNGWNLPADNKAKFVGRAEKLQQVDRQLKMKGNVALTQKYALTGLGGVGKTELAIHYIHRHRHDFEIIIWLQAEQDLDEQFYRLAEALQVSTKESSTSTNSRQVMGAENKRPIKDIVKDIYKKLGNIPGLSLIVFDNADEWQSVKAFFPPDQDKYQSSDVSIMVTSRERRTWDNEINIGLFSEDEARAYIKKNLPKVTDEDADELANRLGRLPLALAQAVAYLRENIIVTIAKYLNKFDRQRARLLQHKIGASSEQDNRSAVLTTWNLSLETIKAKSVAAVSIIEHSAYLDASNIPFFIFESLCERLDEDVDEAISLLYKYSLIELSQDNKSFGVHRLLQEVIQIQQHEPRCHGDWVQQLIKPNDGSETILINQVITNLLQHFQYTLGSKQDTSLLEILIPHLQRSLAYAKRDDVNNEQVGLLLKNLGRYLVYERRATQQSIDYLNDALELVAANHEATGEIFNSLGFAYLLKHQFTQAKMNCRNAQNFFGAQSLGNQESLVTLGHIAYQLGFLEQAQQYYTRARKILIQLDKDNRRYPVRTAFILNSLGNLHSANTFKAYNLTLSVVYYKQAWQLYQSTVSFPSVTKVITLSCLAAAYIGSGELDKAEKWLQRGEDMAKTLWGSHDHLEMANIIARRAELLAKRGNLKQARISYQTALTMFRNLHHWSGQASILTALSYVTRDKEEAKKYLDQALTILSRQNDIVGITAIKTRLHLLAISTGEITCEDTEHFLATIQAQPSTDYKQINLASTCHGIARAWADKRAYPLAIKLYLLAYKIFHSQLGAHPLTLQVLESLIIIYEKQNDFANVVKYCSEALALLDKHQVKEYPRDVRLNVKLAEALSLGDYQVGDAIKQHKKVMSLAQSPIAPSCFNGIIHLILTLLELKKDYADYKSIVETYLGIIQAPLSNNVAKQLQIFNKFAALAYGNNDVETAALYYERMLAIYDAQPKLSAVNAAKANLATLGQLLGLDLSFDKQNTCIVKIDDDFTLHLTYEPRLNRLYCYAPLLDGLPEDKGILLKLYETILQASLLGVKTNDCGIGIAVQEELILIHRYIPMVRVNCLALLAQFGAFIDVVERWRLCCQNIKSQATGLPSVNLEGSQKQIPGDANTYCRDYILMCLSKCKSSVNKQELVALFEPMAAEYKKIVTIAKQNLTRFGQVLQLELSFDADNNCILGIDGKFSLHLTLCLDKKQLFVYSPLLDRLPRNAVQRMKLYEMLLTAAILGGGVAGGGVGVATDEELILMHATIDLQQADENSLFHLATSFVPAVEILRAKCAEICQSSAPATQSQASIAHRMLSWFANPGPGQQQRLSDAQAPSSNQSLNQQHDAAPAEERGAIIKNCVLS